MFAIELLTNTALQFAPAIASHGRADRHRGGLLRDIPPAGEVVHIA
jgi:hypothetical protein